MEVRRAKETDLEGVIDLMKQLGHSLPDGSAAELWSAVSSDGAHDVIVAKADGSIVGMIDVMSRIHLHHGGLVATVDSLVVDGSRRGQRVGTRLLDSALSAVARRGVALVELTSSTARTDAHRFYESNGFTRNGARFVRRLGDGQDDV